MILNTAKILFSKKLNLKKYVKWIRQIVALKIILIYQFYIQAYVSINRGCIDMY